MPLADGDWPTTGIHWVDTIIGACVVLAILGGGFQVIRAHLFRPLRTWLHRFDQFLTDWNGTPGRPGISDGTPGVMERLRSMEYQVNNNGGNSMKDQMDATRAIADRTEDKVDLLAKQLSDHLDKAAKADEAMWAAIKTIAESTPPEHAHEDSADERGDS